jgi:hypothetical protein
MCSTRRPAAFVVSMGSESDWKLAPRRLPHVSGDGDHHYLRNGDMLENAQAMAARESPRTTKLHDRTSDEITLDEVERVAI